MKKIMKKLTLSKETVRRLETEQLAGVVGATANVCSGSVSIREICDEPEWGG